jgi:hypothetical protein
MPCRHVGEEWYRQFGAMTTLSLVKETIVPCEKRMAKPHRPCGHFKGDKTIPPLV